MKLNTSDVISQEESEQTTYINTILATGPIRSLMSYLVSKGRYLQFHSKSVGTYVVTYLLWGQLFVICVYTEFATTHYLMTMNGTTIF